MLLCLLLGGAVSLLSPQETTGLLSIRDYYDRAFQPLEGFLGTVWLSIQHLSTIQRTQAYHLPSKLSLRRITVSAVCSFILAYWTGKAQRAL